MQPLKHVMSRAVTDLVRSAPLSPGKVDFAWGVAVGPVVRRNTAIHLENGLLLIDATSPQWAEEVRRSAAVIMARLRTLLGHDAITRLEVRTR